MRTPSDADLAILRLIRDLTANNEGRPPTLAEIAVAAGLAASSRANIQRQLQALRPTYVDWTTSPRSLRLTDAGHVLLEASPQTTTAPLASVPVDDELLPLLASGLTYLIEDYNTKGRLEAPYPHVCQRSLNRLASACIQRGILTPPQNILAALQWFRQPLSMWPVRFPGYFRQSSEVLMEEDRPSDFCQELARGIRGNAEEQACEQLMRYVITETQNRRTPQSYVAVRRLLIDRPVLPQEDLLTESFRPDLQGVGAYLHSFYEGIPLTPDVQMPDGTVRICGWCGWTLSQVKGIWSCDNNDQCRRRTRNFTVGPPPLQLTPLVPYLRVRRPIRRYISAPGQVELRTVPELEKLGIRVDLWPAYDTYDLRLIFPDEQAWAVDVKDWRYARLLANRLVPIEPIPGNHHTRSLYVVPDDRAADDPDYLRTLRSVAERQDFEIVTVSQLLALARQEVEARYA